LNTDDVVLWLLGFTVGLLVRDALLAGLEPDDPDIDD
jgi:hypothetical protein